MKFEIYNRIALGIIFFIILTPIAYINGYSNHDSSYSSNYYHLNTRISQSSDYQYIWDTYTNADGDLPGDDIMIYGSSFGPFHNYTEITEKLLSLNQTFSNFVDLFSIGKTFLGNDIWCVKITDESYNKPNRNKTQILFVAQHHAREQITVENALYAIDKIIYETTETQDSEYISILKEKKIYIIPTLNIDGASIIHKIPWHRKTLSSYDEDQDGFDQNFNSNTSEITINAQDINGDNYLECYTTTDANYLILGYEGDNLTGLGTQDFQGIDVPGGVDANRNYDYDFGNPYFSSSNPRSQIFHGNTAFSENCTRVLRDFIQQHFFQASVSLHSGIKAIYYPEITLSSAKGDSDEDKSNEVEFFNTMIEDISELTEFQHGPSTNFAGMFSPWIYFTEEQIEFAICLETYGNHLAYQYVEVNQTLNYQRVKGIWDYFNPPANKVIDNSKLIYKALFHILQTNYKEYNESTISSFPIIPTFLAISITGCGIIISKLQKRRINKK